MKSITILWILFFQSSATSSSIHTTYLIHLYPSFSYESFPTLGNNREVLFNSLYKFHTTSQEPLVSFLQSNSNSYESLTQLWIQNTIIVHNPTSKLLQILEETKPFYQIKSIKEDFSITLPITTTGSTTEIQTETIQSNIRLVKAPEAWSHGINGTSVVLASIDSGVRYTHHILRNSYRGLRPNSSYNHEYNFWTPLTTNKSLTPDNADPVGHGTHTMGTAVGNSGYGIAPGAKWITARAFDKFGSSSQSTLLTAAQWVMCPTNSNNTNHNCSLGANVVSCAFGTPDKNTTAWFNDVIIAWRNAGIIPVFASGNVNGFKCHSVLYPASNPNVLAVGALITASRLWAPSGKGPGEESIKPDYVAPGFAIASALSTSDTGITRLTGTSMATPAVAGTLALYLSSNKSEANMRHGCETSGLKRPFFIPITSCGNTRYNIFPNNIYGNGLVQAPV